MKRSFQLAVLLAAALCQPALANNIQVSNVAIADQDAVTDTANIVFDLSWENSWRLSTGPANWDAAWVFVKYHNGDNVWRHAKLSTVDAQHFVPAGATLKTGATGAHGMGAFIHRSAAGSGNNVWTGIKLKWNYGADGILDTAIITADVQAIEMVYVPQGAFYVGDGSTPSFRYASGLDRALPYQITSSLSVPIGNTAGEINEGRIAPGFPPVAVSGPGAASTSIYPAAFPNGFAAFYCMKYEASQGQYARHINTGGFVQYENNFYSATRQASSGSIPNLVATAPDRAYVAYSDQPNSNPVGRYASWAGLRPMSDFEYEKACRGPVYPVAGECAWGTAVPASLAYTLANDGSPTEAVATNYNPNAGNVWSQVTSGSFAGPCRVGMFAMSSYSGSTSPRIQAGASYWGILDLTGGVLELAAPATPATFVGTTAPPDPQNHVLVGSTYYGYPASLFRGTHGDGSPNYPVDWHGVILADLSNNSALGGDFSKAPTPVSSLTEPAFSPNVTGIRCVRTAP